MSKDSILYKHAGTRITLFSGRIKATASLNSSRNKSHDPHVHLSDIQDTFDEEAGKLLTRMMRNQSPVHQNPTQIYESQNAIKYI